MKNIQKVRARRMALGIPQIALAAKAGIDPSRLNRLERCYLQPSEAELQRLSTALALLIDERLDQLAREKSVMGQALVCL